MTMLPKFQALEAELNEAVFEREAEIRGLAVGTIARRHVYLLGEPGVGKSLLVSELTRRIDGANMFDTLMARTSLPEQIFGPVDLAQLKAGRYRRVPVGKIQEAHFAFLDEIFKCNSAILNSLLRILNERQYDDGGSSVKVPLISCISASNELPQGEDLNAMFDRLHLRFVVHRLQEDDSVAKLLTLNGPSAVKAKITLAEVEAAQLEASKVTVGPAAITSFKEVRVACEKQGIRVSDRRLRELVAVAQAEAWLNGHAEVQPGDLAILQHGLWSAPEERKKVVDVVYSVSCPFMPKALELLDMIAEQRSLAKTGNGSARAEAFGKISDADEEINTLGKANGATATPQFQAVIKKSKAIRREVGELLVGKK